MGTLTFSNMETRSDELENCDLETLQKKLQVLEAQQHTNQRLITRQLKDINTIEEGRNSKLLHDKVENRKRALLRARQKFEQRKKHFYNHDLPAYEEKVLKIAREVEAEERKAHAKKSDYFEDLLKELNQLCKCRITKKQFKDPTSVPSGNIYERKVAMSILKGKYKNLGESTEPNLFRGDKFTQKLIQIISKYKNIDKADEEWPGLG